MKTDKKSLMRKSVALANQDVLAKDLERVQTIGRSHISATAILKAFANKPQMTINDIVTVTKYARKNVINLI